MMESLLQVVMFLASLVIVFRAESILARMDEKSHHAMRFGVWLTASGGLLSVVWLLYGNVPSWPVVSLAAGIAVMLLFDRRPCDVLAADREPPRGAT